MRQAPVPPVAVGRRQRLFLAIAAFARRRYGWVALVAALALAGGFYLGSKLRLESDVLDLIPSGNRQVDAYRRSLADFGSVDYLFVLIEAGEGEGAEEVEEFADEYGERLGALTELVGSVEYRFQPDPSLLQLVSENALLFVPPAELPRIAARLTDEAIERQVREDRRALLAPSGPLSGALVQTDPLGLMPFIMERLLGHHGGLKVDLTSGYYLSADGRSLIMLVKLRKPSVDLEFSRRLCAAALAEAESARQELAAGRGRPVTTRVRLSGNPATLVEEAALLGDTIVTIGLVSLFTVLALYLVCYRRLAALLYSSLPLLVGQALTLAVAYFTLGSLNSVSAALPALLMGLGTDFTILMYARYVEERRAGASLAAATEAMAGQTGLGVFTGAITSAGTFYALCVSRSHGLRDLGFLIGTGILLCAAAILFLLPAMIAWNEGGRRRRSDPVRKLHLQSIGLERLAGFSARRPRLAVGLVAALTLASGYLAAGIDFDDTLQALRSNRSASYQVQQEIAARFGASLTYMVAIAEGPTLEQADALARRIETRLQPYLADGTIGRIESIHDYLPPAETQTRVLEELRAGAGGPFDSRRIRAAFSAALRANGFREEPFAGYLDRLGALLSPARPIQLEDLEGKGLGRMADRFVKRAGDQARIATYFYPTDPRWKRRTPPGLVEAVVGGDEGITVTGTNVIGQEMRLVFTSDARRALLLGLALVALLLVIDFRDLRLAAIALAQLVAGITLMFGCMRLFGIMLNYANAFVATMIMGVGIDYSLHLIHRLQMSGGALGDGEGLAETSKGVVLAALTNVAGFGTLVLARYPALRSLGVVALIGSITCLFTALMLVPALMVRRPDGRRPRPAAAAQPAAIPAPPE